MPTEGDITRAAPAMPVEREPLYHVRGLARVYGEGPAAVTALAGVGFDLFARELVVLLGASGSGKSTLLNQLGGLDSPTHGTLRYRGWNLGAGNEAELTSFRRGAVGFVFQAYNLIPSLTARENVALITEICRDPMTPPQWTPPTRAASTRLWRTTSTRSRRCSTTRWSIPTRIRAATARRA